MISVILLMAGSGRRMNIEDNKVFLPLGEKRVFEHALQMFLALKLSVSYVQKIDSSYLTIMLR